MLPRTLLLALLLAIAGQPAVARSLRIVGTAGYLSEWELSGNVTEKVSARGAEFFGPITWKHVGVCSVNGPQEKAGEIDFQVFQSGATSRIAATLRLDDTRCTYSGNLAQSMSGTMDCSKAQGVPLTLSIK